MKKSSFREEQNQLISDNLKGQQQQIMADINTQAAREANPGVLETISRVADEVRSGSRETLQSGQSGISEISSLVSIIANY